MIALRSVFDLQEFVILKNFYEFQPPPKGNVSISELTADYIIDIDFTIKPQNKEHLSFQVFVKIEVNKDFVLPGYDLFIEGLGFFKFDKKDGLSDDEKLTFLQTSGISICINCLRSILGGLTAHGPFGKYLLPSIDVNDLLNQKTIRMEKMLKKNPKSKAVKTS
jgi:preprotein translocase subunit SecB